MTVNGGGEGIKLIVVDSVFLTLSCIAVVLRLCARGLRKQSLQLNDWLIMIALVCQIGQSVLENLDVAFGDVALSSGQRTSASDSWSNNFNFPGAIIWGLPLLFIKLSVLHFYYVVFPTRKFRWLCILMTIVVMTFFVAYTMVVVLSCIPISSDWDQSVHGTCINLNLRVLVTAAVNVGIDLLVVLLPMPVVRRLQLSAPKLLTVCAIFGLGLSVCAVSGLRIYFLTQTDVDSVVNFNITTLLEPNLGTVVACLPLLWPIAKSCIPDRSNSPDSEITHVNRWTPDVSTLPDDEEMAKRIQHGEKPAGEKPTRVKPQARDEEKVYQPRPRLPPRAELQGKPRLAGRSGDRSNRDRPLSRIIMTLSGSRPISWRRRSDWPLSEDVERELSGNNSARDSGASDLKALTVKRLELPTIESSTKPSEETIVAALSRSSTQKEAEPLSRSNTQKEKEKEKDSNDPPTNTERTRTLDSTTSSLGRKNSAAQRLTSAAATLKHPSTARTPLAPARAESRSDALGGASSEDPSRWESRTPHSPLRSPVGRSPAFTPPPKRGSPALQPGSMPPVPSSKQSGVPQRSKSAKERSRRKEAAPAGNPPPTSRLAVDKKTPLVSNPDVLTPGAPPSPMKPMGPQAGPQGNSGRSGTSQEQKSATTAGPKREYRKTMPSLGSADNRESVSADLDSEWGKDLARSVAAMTKEENWIEGPERKGPEWMDGRKEGRNTRTH